MNVNALDPAIVIIERHLAHTPKDQLDRELVMIIDRLAFVPQFDDLLQQRDLPAIKSTLYYLFQEDISPAMQQCLAELADQQLASVLVKPQSDQLLAQISARIKQASEIKVVSAVALDEAVKANITNKIIAKQGQTRVVFEVFPGLVAGCLIIDDQDQLHDFSLKNNLNHHLHRYLEYKAKHLWGADA